jgi:CRP/FNR family transcriptional regulator, cyclic AMP receptor protein
MRRQFNHWRTIMASGCLCRDLAGEELALSSNCIGNLWVFKNLQPEELGALAQRALRKIHERGEPIFLQGDRADSMFLIKAGRVKLSKTLEDGIEITLDIRKAGDFLGENMLSEEIEYPVTAWCLEKTLICGFSKASFERIVLDYPNIGLQVIRNLSTTIASLTDRVGSMSLSNLEDRLHSVLLNVSREHGVRGTNGYTIQFPLTHEDLSFLTGAHRVSITRAMKSLKEAGKIIQQGRTLTLPFEADLI